MKLSGSIHAWHAMIALAAIAAPAVAQDEAEAPASGETAADGNAIVVTGLRRSAELQTTPAAITAFNAQAIEDILLLAECSRDGEWEGQVIYLPL